MTVDGFERTWALNHLAYFLLTLELLDLLKASAPARIVNVASTMHNGGVIDFDNLQGENGYGGVRAYSQSKLANVLFTYALARRLKGSGVTANCLHPGGVATRFGHNHAGMIDVILRLAKPFLLTAEQGAATPIYLASSPDVASVSGEYFARCKPARSSAASHDEALQERLWALSLQQIGADGPAASLKTPGVDSAR
jgi:NAD(P)-dependent dehydrogenase (short-subunit alcohol dehydrogenase family)